MRKYQGDGNSAGTVAGPFGHSRASSRYEGGGVVEGDEYDRTRILLEWVGGKKRVLEIGCSTGYISRLLRQRECDVIGVEIDAAAAEQARAYCREVHVLDLDVSNWIAALPKGEFEVVLLGDVLEHLVRPDATLLQLSRVLGPQGRLVISLPNVVHWVTRLKVLFGRFDYESWGTLDHTHLRFFTPRSARALIEAAGYRVTRFHPAIGGRLAGHVRPAWQWLANRAPGLFAYQMLFEARNAAS